MRKTARETLAYRPGLLDCMLQIYNYVVENSDETATYMHHLTIKMSGPRGSWVIVCGQVLFWETIPRRPSVLHCFFSGGLGIYFDALLYNFLILVENNENKS